ncbi:MAG: ABC transporter permease, partial [Anaerolineae bacterium]|nr:ABC transporter permease [Anaerolineae bacterium]
MKRSHWYYVSLGIVYFFLLGPFLIIFAAAFGEESTLSFPPQGFSLNWFANVFATQQFIYSFWTSLQLGLLATAIALILGTPVAYALTHFHFPGEGLVETVFSLPILVPGLVIGL